MIKNIETVYNRLKSGRYRFETVVGRQFDDTIYELYKRYCHQTVCQQQTISMSYIKDYSRKKN